LGAPNGNFFHEFFIWERQVQISSTLFSFGSAKCKFLLRIFHLEAPNGNFFYAFFIRERQVQISSTLFSFGSAKRDFLLRIFHSKEANANFLSAIVATVWRSPIFR